VRINDCLQPFWLTLNDLTIFGPFAVQKHRDIQVKDIERVERVLAQVQIAAVAQIICIEATVKGTNLAQCQMEGNFKVVSIKLLCHASQKSATAQQGSYRSMIMFVSHINLPLSFLVFLFAVFLAIFGISAGVS